MLEIDRPAFRRLSPAFLILALAVVAPPVGAASIEAAPLVDVTSDPNGASGVVHGSVDINAKPAAVWRVLIDCAGAPKLMVNMKSCRVTRQDAAGRWDERETISKGSILPPVRIVLHADYEPDSRVRFHRIDGDIKVLDGEWRLEPLDGGARTRVTYDSRVTAGFGAPGPIVRAVLRRDMPRTLSNLRDACEAAAQAG